MDECEEKKIMDKVIGNPMNEFAGKERVCDQDVEKVLWKLGEEPAATAEKSSAKSASDALTKEEILPGIEDISAHAMAP